MSFLSFLIEWFRGPAGVLERAGAVLRELGWCLGPMKKCTFSRELYAYEGLELWFKQYIAREFKNTNIFMGIGFMVDSSKTELEFEHTLYDRLCYDFDSGGSPKTAVDVALRFAESVESSYSVTPVVFLSGFKGAHVVIPLAKPTDWEGYQLLWRALLKLVPRAHRQLVDRNVLQWNRLDRVPLTWSVKEVSGVVKRSFAKVIYPQEFTWETFKWSKLRALDPSSVEVHKVVLPDLKKAAFRATKALASSSTAYSWIERVVEKGLPDGRHRFILYFLSAYLVNVKQLSVEEAFQVVKKFVENSCKNFGNCSKVYDSFIISDLRRVREKKLKPMSLKSLQQRDSELFNIITSVLNSK